MFASLGTKTDLQAYLKVTPTALRRYGDTELGVHILDKHLQGESLNPLRGLCMQESYYALFWSIF